MSPSFPFDIVEDFDSPSTTAINPPTHAVGAPTTVCSRKFIVLLFYCSAVIVLLFHCLCVYCWLSTYCLAAYSAGTHGGSIRDCCSTLWRGCLNRQDRVYKHVVAHSYQDRGGHEQIFLPTFRLHSTICGTFYVELLLNEPEQYRRRRRPSTMVTSPGHCSISPQRWQHLEYHNFLNLYLASATKFIMLFLVLSLADNSLWRTAPMGG